MYTELYALITWFACYGMLKLVQYLDRVENQDNPHGTEVLITRAPRETARAGVRIWELARRWGIGLPRRLAELLLPPHIVCPPVFEHLSLKQWRDNAKEYFGQDGDGMGWCGRNGKTVFEWLEARNLPPVPQDKYCPEKTAKWVNDTERDREAYLKEVRG